MTYQLDQRNINEIFAKLLEKQTHSKPIRLFQGDRNYEAFREEASLRELPLTTDNYFAFLIQNERLLKTLSDQELRKLELQMQALGNENEAEIVRDLTQGPTLSIYSPQVIAQMPRDLVARRGIVRFPEKGIITGLPFRKGHNWEPNTMYSDILLNPTEGDIKKYGAFRRRAHF